MSNRRLTPACALLVACAFGARAFAGPPLAVPECESTVQNDSRFHDARDSTAQELGPQLYKVSGIVKDERGRDHRYSCRHEFGEVVSYNVDSTAPASSGGKAAAVGAGLIGLAAVAAIAKHEDDQNHRKKRDAYSRGDNYAFDDRDYLRRECAQEIRYHVDRDHGKVSSIDLQAPYVHDRVMTGTGEIYFRNGGSRELRYTCNFDRSGRIYDGRYTYVSAGYPGHSDYSNYEYRGNRGGGSSEYRRGYDDGARGNEFDDDRHPQDYKDGYRDGERDRWYR